MFNFMILYTSWQQGGENLENSTNFAGQQWPTQTWYKSRVFFSWSYDSSISDGVTAEGDGILLMCAAGALYFFFDVKILFMPNVVSKG